MHGSQWRLLCVAALFVALAVLPAVSQLTFSQLPPFKYNGTLRVAFVFTAADLPDAKLCQVETFYNQLASGMTNNNKTCYNLLETAYWTIPVPLNFSTLSTIYYEIQAFNATIMVGSANYVVTDLAKMLGITNYQIYQLPLSRWGQVTEGLTSDLLTATINQLSGNAYYQFINTIYYYIAYGSNINATYKEQIPKYGNNQVNYTHYHNTLAEQMNIQTAILQSNQLPYSGGIMLLYDLSLDIQFVTMLLNSWSTRYQTDRRYYLELADVTFADKDSGLIGIVNGTLNSTSLNMLFMVYTTTSNAQQLLSIINSGSFLSTTADSQQIYWTFVNITLLYSANITIQSLIFHWELLQTTIAKIAAGGHCTASTIKYSMWNCLLENDFANWLFKASKTDCTAELTAFKTMNLTGYQLYSNLTNAFLTNSYYGYTGLMKFDRTGARTTMTASFHLGLQNYDREIFNCNFTINYTNIAATTRVCSTPRLPVVQSTVNGVRFVKVVTYNLPPFYYVQNGVPTGINVDMINAIADLLDLNCTIVPIDTIGEQDPTSLKWSGLIGSLVYQEADFAVAALPVTTTYQSVIQYSSVYMEEQWSMLMARPDQVTFLDGLVRIFQPYDGIQWLLIIIAILVSSGILTILDYIIPNSIAFDFSRSFYFCMGRAIQGMGGASPDAVSSRVLIIFWSSICVFIIQSYVANMAALLLYDQQIKTSITSPYTILPNGYYPASMYNSPAANYYESTADYQDHLLWTGGMSSNLIKTADEILAKVSNGSYVFIGQLNTNTYLAQNNPCYETIDSFGGEAYALATPVGVNQVTIQELNNALQQLTTTGTLQSIIANYTQTVISSVPSSCKADVAWTMALGETDTTILDTVKMSGLFVIMGLGCVLSIVIAIGERISSLISESRRKKQEKLLALRRRPRRSIDSTIEVTE